MLGNGVFGVPTDWVLLAMERALGFILNYPYPLPSPLPNTLFSGDILSTMIYLIIHIISEVLSWL